jgi:hypothetical protein
MPIRTAVTQLVEAARAKDLAARLPERQSSAFVERAESSIETILDDYCGTPPRHIPWPWPGPPPWVFEIVSALSAEAYAVEAGGLRDNLLDIAGRALQKAGALAQ